MAFFRFFRLRRLSSSDGNGQRLHKYGKSLKKTFLECLAKCDSRRNSSGKSHEETRHPVASKTPTKIMLKTNKNKLRVFKKRDNWTTVKVLGVGAYGKVILIKKVKSKEMVAKKVVPLRATQTSYVSAAEEVIHFQMEHPNIISLFCWEKLQAKLHLFMEYCPGGDVKGNLERITHEDAFYYFSQMTDGVEYLHGKGVVHRDLKPDNLLLTQEGGLKIADFGLAGVFIIEDKEVELSGRVGTRPYMAPEVLRGSSYLGPPVDIWSCGVILINMLTKERPWDEAIPRNKNYGMWLDEDENLRNLVPWRMLDQTAWSLVRLLLEPDPHLRLSGWRKHRQN
ncbi:serine/threonine-protein kinase Chk1-like [Oratosquilla oratoria]|uniref:serine/threonine-protein kinase Chk1-like n=1 Tax=Oratosquilla oratoria TaxID=337810 RepID=UPI003F7694BC